MTFTEACQDRGTFEVVARSRLISADTRSGILIALGVALPATAFALGLSAGPLVAGLAIAALMIGLGLAGTASSGRGTLPVRALAAYDQGLALGLLATAAIFAVAQDAMALSVFGAAGVITLMICFATRYSPGPRAASQNFL
jgi:hypothetical protein